MSVNKAILVGNLGRDPEVRQTNSGTAVTTLSIATNERQKDRDGNWTDHTEWHRVVVFGATADACGRFLSKGRQVYIEGKIRTRKWTDKDGRDRYSTEVLADSVQFLQGGGDSGGGRGGQSGGGYGAGTTTNDSGGYGGGYGGGDGGDDGVPF